MEGLYVFGTGDAQTTHCYNACSTIKGGDEYFMVDAEGGNDILRILEDMDVDLCHIHNTFITRERTDHIMGIAWMARMVAAVMKKGECEGGLQIYCHQGLVDTISTICRLTIQSKFYKMIGSRVFLVPMENSETVHVLDYGVTFFDILSTKARQLGSTTTLKNDRRPTYAGDEPYNARCHPYVENSDWLLHEAFYLYRDRGIFEPYKKHHSTVKEACRLVKELSIPNLVLWHTGGKYLSERKALYTAEGRKYYDGNLLVPDDGETIPL